MTAFSNIGSDHPAGYTDVSPSALTQLPNATRLIDVREPHEFNDELGHLDGAESFPLGVVASAAADWSRDTPLLLICRSGRRSIAAADALKKLGFNHLGNLSGGMLAARGG